MVTKSISYKYLAFTLLLLIIFSIPKSLHSKLPYKDSEIAQFIAAHRRNGCKVWATEGRIYSSETEWELGAFIFVVRGSDYRNYLASTKSGTLASVTYLPEKINDGWRDLK